MASYASAQLLAALPGASSDQPGGSRGFCGSGGRLRLVIKRLATGALLALACPSRPKKALALYRDRWTIETLFANLKTRRFDLEATHLRQTGKLKTLVALLAIAVALAAKTGVAVKAVKTVPVKRHGRPAMSLFSVGLTSLKRLLARPDAGRDSIMFEHIIANRKLSKQRLGNAFSSRV